MKVHKAADSLTTLYGAVLFPILLFFPAFLLIENYFSKGYVYFSFLLLLPFAIIYSRRRDYREPQQLRSFLSIVFLVVVYIYISGYMGQEIWGGAQTRFAVASEIMVKFLLPLVLLPALYLLRPDRDFVMAAVVLSAFPIVGNLAYNIALDAPRDQQSYGAPIIWGNLSLLAGLFAMILARHTHIRSERWLLMAVALVGLAGSLYSGTRGGWIVLATLPFFYVVLIKDLNFLIRLLPLLLLTLGLFFLLLYFLVPSVHSRVDQAIFDLQRVMAGDFSGSIGSRFLMWWAAIKAFLSAPITGIGLGNFFAYKSDLIARGELPSFLMRYKHEHSMYMTVMGSLGIAGILLITLLFVFLFRMFRQLLQTRRTFIWGEMGLVLLLSYLDFGLSESFLFTHMGAAAFFYWTTLLLYLGYADGEDVGKA